MKCDISNLWSDFNKTILTELAENVPVHSSLPGIYNSQVSRNCVIMFVDNKEKN